MTQDTRTDRSLERHTGADALLKLSPEGAERFYEVPITDFSWTRDYSNEQIQHNGSLNPTLTTTEIRYTGSFEYQGQNPEVIDLLMEGESSSIIDRNRPVRCTITSKEYDHENGDDVIATVTFKRALITSNERTVASGEVSSTSFDWEAEDMKYVDETSE